MFVERVPVTRIFTRLDAPPRAGGHYVLYWMTSARRTRYNFALDRALEWARHLGKPLLVFEPLRAAYPHASDRMHAFAIDGMKDQQRALTAAGVRYLPYLEPEHGAARGLLAALARDASVVIGDETATFFLPRMIDAASPQITTRFETVDSVGLLPLSLVTTPFARAYDFRRFLQKNLAPHLRTLPLAEPLAGYALGQTRVHAATLARFDLVAQGMRIEHETTDTLVAALPIDHGVSIAPDRGGSEAARARLRRFVKDRLSRYGEERSHPDDDAASGLSFWLHWGHLSAHEVLAAVADATDWTPDRIGTKTAGHKDGWWNMSESADAFMDELCTWRELGQARCRTTTDFLTYEGVPNWARLSLERHLGDPRPHIYSEAQLEAGETEDAVWNAAMHELRAEGRIQNYLRMLWGKRTLTWTAHPKEAFDILVRLNDRYSIDGRDPASYSNIGWVFGAYDRPWAPERPIFGSIRTMTSASAVRKLRMKAYLSRWETGLGELPAKVSKQRSLDID
jgi:deoxyribodipyrimidine photo-lyase